MIDRRWTKEQLPLLAYKISSSVYRYLYHLIDKLTMMNDDYEDSNDSIYTVIIIVIATLITTTTTIMMMMINERVLS